MFQRQIRSGLIIAALLALLVSCGNKASDQADSTKRESVSGGRSGIFVIDALVVRPADSGKARRAALLGVFVSEFVSKSPVALVNGGIVAIGVQNSIYEKQSTVSDPDFDLIQAFADALQVDVLDLLNRSTNRQETLDTYITSLTNIAERANTRLAELTEADDVQTEALRQLNRERADLERELRNATNSKDYLLANEKQKLLNEKERQIAEADGQLNQVKNVSKTLEELLQLYNDKLLAIQENREPLIAGTKVVDLPGTLDLKILERRGNSSGGSSGGGSRTSGQRSTSGSAGGSTGGTGRATGGTGNRSATGADGKGDASSSAPSTNAGSNAGNSQGGTAGNRGATGGNASGRDGTSGGTSDTSSTRVSSSARSGGGSRLFGNPFGSFNTNRDGAAATTGGAGGGTGDGNGGGTGAGTDANTGGGGNVDAGDGGSGGYFDIGALTQNGSFNDLIALIIALLLVFSLFLSLIFLIIGGLKFITSAGDEEKIKKAVGTIRYSLLGLVVSLMGYFIVWWLAKLLDVPFDLSFGNILDLMRQLFSRFSQPIE